MLAAAAAIEWTAGYPDALFRRAGHPVTWMGALISRLEGVLNGAGLAALRRRLGGLATLGVLLVASAGAAALGERALGRLRGGGTLRALAASSLLAARSLERHVRAVADAPDLPAARRALARIVGRDVASLDAAAVRRAAIESLAENFSDGVVAPALFLAAGGLAGGALYKAANTADSMIGHRTPRFEAFGGPAARLDDLLNLAPARLSALLLALASGAPAGPLRAAWRDAPAHRSPNAGWPEAAMAAALGIRIGGPRAYHGVEVAGAWMGRGRAEVTAEDLRRALALYRRACLLALVLVTAGAARRPSS